MGIFNGRTWWNKNETRGLETWTPPEPQTTTRSLTIEDVQRAEELKKKIVNCLETIKEYEDILASVYGHLKNKQSKDGVIDYEYRCSISGYYSSNYYGAHLILSMPKYETDENGIIIKVNYEPLKYNDKDIIYSTHIVVDWYKAQIAMLKDGMADAEKELNKYKLCSIEN